jgi:hypothetical protein
VFKHSKVFNEAVYLDLRGMAHTRDAASAAAVPVPDDHDLSPQARSPESKRSRLEGNFTEAALAAMWKQTAFLARRQESRLSKKGREIRSIPEKFKKDYAKSDLDEWRKWLKYDAVELVPDDVAAKLDKDGILPLRPVRTDKNEATRGDKSYEQHPVIAKTRLVCPGYADPQALATPLQTDAPTLSAEGTALIYAEAAGNGWRLEQGDVDSAFLNGRYLDPDRLVYFRVPKGGLPSTDGQHLRQAPSSRRRRPAMA